MTDTALLSDADYARILNARLDEPAALRRALAGRPRRPLLGADRRLMLLAADHTARGMLSVGDDPLALANRRTLLSRLALGLDNPQVDGVMASADILEELALLGSLDRKLAIGTMNRGGIKGASWELDDRVTAYDVDHLVSSGLDGGKTLLRIEPTDAGVARTIETVGRVITALADAGVMSLVEPLPYLKDSVGTAFLDPSEAALVRAVAIASGLGSSSAFTWLKIPATVNPNVVAAATTCPILLLGGDVGSSWERVFTLWKGALAIPNVRGLVPGRALLYPEGMDAATAIERAAALVHGAPGVGTAS